MRFRVKEIWVCFRITVREWNRNGKMVERSRMSLRLVSVAKIVRSSPNSESIFRSGLLLTEISLPEAAVRERLIAFDCLLCSKG
jgi:hypothetical protein